MLPQNPAEGSNESVEFDSFDGSYSAGMENPLKQLAGDCQSASNI